MKVVKLLAETAGVDPALPDRWYVTNGTGAVGPVGLELIARGIEAGKVPVDSCFVRHEAWKIWRPLRELAVVDALANEDSGVFDSFPTDDLAEAPRPLRLDEQMPSDALAGAADLHDAVLLLLSAAVQQSDADCALLHRMEGDNAVVVSSHGPAMFDVLGTRTPVVDPAVMAASAGLLVVAEPAPGPAGAAVIERLSALGVAAVGGVMVPIRPHGRLLGMIELGRRTPFRASEVAAIEALAAALVATIESRGWDAQAA
jgi:hypothetical protein